MKFSTYPRSSTIISLLLVLLWTALGLGIRWLNLDLKPASSIEIATIGYSLGHGFNQIPLDQVVDLDTLLAPLRLDSTIGYAEVFRRLGSESTHPPLYFWLTRWWSALWLQDGDLVSLQVARSLSVIFGVLAIPSIFVLGWVACRSRLVAHLAAVLMAFSPYGVYLAQEARHYTLTILWVIFSLLCLVIALRTLQQKKSVSLGLRLIWIVINALGIATHYFFVLVLGAEAIAIGFWLLFNREQQFFRYLRSLSLAGIGTLVSGLVWLPMARGVAESEMTSWITTSYELQDIFLPIPRLLTWGITMVMLLPVEGVTEPLAIISCLIILAILIWATPTLIQQGCRAIANSPTRFAMIILIGYLIGTLVLFLGLVYGGGKDITLAARYHFVYFPPLILLLAIALANCRLKSISPTSASNRVVVVVIIMGLLGSLTVVSNFGFQKSRRSDALAAYIQQTATSPTLVAMTHQTHSEIRELVALAFSFERIESTQSQSMTPQFLLVSDNQYGQEQILPNLNSLTVAPSSSLNLVGVNFALDKKLLPELNCQRDRQRNLADSGYNDRFYLCNP